MATAEYGDLNLTPVTTGQDNKVASINASDAELEKCEVGYLALDLTGLSGTVTPTEAQVKNMAIAFGGAPSGNVVVETNANVRKFWMVYDNTSGGFAVTFQPVGESGVTVPKKRWTRVGSPITNTSYLYGWTHPADAGSPTYGANYQEVSGREVLLYKEDATVAATGGVAFVEGAVEETTTPPANGDTIVTLPANYRPAKATPFVAVADPATTGSAEPVLVEVQTSGAVVLRNVLNWTPATSTPIDLTGLQFFVGN